MGEGGVNTSGQELGSTTLDLRDGVSNRGRESWGWEPWGLATVGVRAGAESHVGQLPWARKLGLGPVGVSYRGRASQLQEIAN